jgi:hypothetical protein
MRGGLLVAGLVFLKNHVPAQRRKKKKKEKKKKKKT